MHARRRVHRLVCSLLVSASLAAIAARGSSWPAVDPAELAATQAALDPDAGFEVLSRETTIDDSDPAGVDAEHFFRLKVFNKAGAEKLSKVEINFDRTNTSVNGIEARTIKPDGTILELKRGDVYEREVMRQGDVRARVKAFAPPGVEPGAIIEYRYHTFSDHRAPMYPFVFQTDAPVRSVRYRFRPFSLQPGLNMQVLYLNCPKKELKPTRDGYYEFSATNLPAHKDEPMQPPAVHLRPAVVLYYTYELAKTPQSFWNKLSEKLQSDTKAKTKPTKPIVAEAQRLVAPTDSADEKLRKLHDYCREKIQNRSSDASGLTREQRRKLAANDDATDTLKAASGSRDDINALFVALARALGFDARLALGNDRSLFVYNANVPVPFVFVRLVAAVRTGDHWTYFDPGARYLPGGMLDWRVGDTSIIVANEKGALIEPIKSAPSERSFRHQVAKLAVNDDGSLEGDVTLDYSGYFEATEKNALDQASPDDAEKHLRAALDAHLKGAELTEVKVENAAQPLAPLRVSFHLRVPEFAERTGSRLFIQPNIFRRGAKALFEAPKRESSILFPHRYHETDDVTITLPEGAKIEAGSAPLGWDLSPALKYNVEISWSAKSRTVHLQRDFDFNVVGFAAEHYPKVKRIFEVIQERDDHTLSFRFGDEPAAKPEAPATDSAKTP